ncbi:MAG: iron-sulfur cluster-binding protein [Anaerolineales bacterium]|nr:iron-sulfur cluster-binding protein [Anaerolineales bacterium]
MKPRDKFHKLAKAAIADPFLQRALDINAGKRRSGMKTAFDSFPDPNALRGQARAIRADVIDNLEDYQARFIEKVTANGFQVHLAADAAEATRLIVALAQGYGAKLVTKSKSMVTEEIHLNEGLEAAGFEVVETDLGEYIVQLRGEKPTHIITPAVHLRREDVAKTFEEKLGMIYTTDVAVMTALARETLREAFLTCDIGISGVNFGVVESGTLCLVTNEGNGRMVTGVPPVHIAVMGMERMLPTLDDLTLMLQVLPRSATGQKLSSYVTLINRPRQPGDPDGPDVRHLVIVDNRRRAVRDSYLRETLYCIRCGACLNACPVYQEVGGVPYDSVYPGPIGSLVSNGLFGVENYGHLSKASTLCGACVEACPVQINFTDLLLETRDRYIRAVPQPATWKSGMKFYSWVAASPRRYRLALKLAAWGMALLPNKKQGWITGLPGPLAGWTDSRNFPPFAAKTFHARWQALKQENGKPIETGGESVKADTDSQTASAGNIDLVAQFTAELAALSGEVVRCTAAELPALIVERLGTLDVTSLVVWAPEQLGFPGVWEALAATDIQTEVIDLTEEAGGRQGEIERLGQVQAGLTGATAALADTATLVQVTGSQASQFTSLLPPVHLAVISTQDFYPSLEDWMAAGGKQVIADASTTTLISGPSRTGDIEMTLTVGVHGPGTVIVFCVD